METNKVEGFLNKNKYYIFLLVAIILVGLVWWFGGSILWNQFGGENKANLRGDAYGALNTLFSGLAFAGIIISILMQSEELKLQREELKDTRNEIKLQRLELEGQKQIMQEQLEGQKNQTVRSFITFMIEGLRNSINSVSIDVIGTNSNQSKEMKKTVYGRDAFHVLTGKSIGIEDSSFVINKTVDSIDPNKSLKEIIDILNEIESYIDIQLKDSSLSRKNFYKKIVLQELSSNELRVLRQFIENEGIDSNMLSIKQ